jgi:hypothetical protein
MPFWTNRDDDQLIEMVRQAMTEAVIAEALGRTPAAVQARKAQLRREGRLEPSREAGPRGGREPVP